MARAAETVRWSEVRENVNGVKHKRISVLFENHVRENTSALVAELAELKTLLAAQAAQIAQLEAALRTNATRAAP